MYNARLILFTENSRRFYVPSSLNNLCTLPVEVLELTEYVDCMSADNVLAELHVEAVTDHHQSSLVSVYHSGCVGGCDPPAFWCHSSALCGVTHTLPTYMSF